MRKLSSFRCGKRDLLKLAAAVAIVAPAAISAFPSVFPTGTTIYDPAKAHNQYVLFAGADHKTHLIDMNGNEVRTWDYPGQPSGMLDPALIGGKRGHVVLQTGKGGGMETGLVPGALVQANKSLGEVDWNGNIVWSFGEKAPGGEARQHHDWARLANGNTLVLSDIRRPIPGFANPEPVSDAIYEVSQSGDIVWTWDMSEHLDELGFTPSEMTLIKASKEADYFHVNTMRPLGPNHWYRDGDNRFAPDNIIISSRNANFIAIIDKASSEIVWRVGPSYENWENRGPLPQDIDQIVGQHDPHMIPEGLPGAGNILIFDNQGEAGYPPAVMKMNGGSRVIEINPVTRKIVWEYTGSSSGSPDWSFLSSFISNARRLPNGNTFIDEGMNGRFFQVTPAGEIVWEYVSPYSGDAPPSPRGNKVTSNWVYRAQPVPYDWVPEGTPRTEAPVIPPALKNFHVSQ